ncbi:hypothetical protein HN873_034552, partial [Arachis hypogaea]
NLGLTPLHCFLLRTVLIILVAVPSSASPSSQRHASSPCCAHSSRCGLPPRDTTP